MFPMFQTVLIILIINSLLTFSVYRLMQYSRPVNKSLLKMYVH